MSKNRILDVFPSKFFEITIDDGIAVNILEEVKSIEQQFEVNEHYSTSYGSSICLELFEKTILFALEQLKHIGLSATLEQYWFAAYKSKCAHHKLHDHTNGYIVNKPNYSGILYLSDQGATAFYSQNVNSLENKFLYGSRFGSIIMFPSTIPHEYEPLSDNIQTRYVLPFNLSLKYEQSKSI